MKKIISLSVLFLLVISSCKKQNDLPEPEVNDPHFYVNCTMDGQPLNIQAGNDDYYMNASSYYQDSDRVFVYKANLAKQSSAGYQVTILFNETEATKPSNAMKVDSTLVIGKKIYNDIIINGTTQVLIFEAIKKTASANYKWNITDGITQIKGGGSGTANSVYSATLEVGKTYSVTLDYDDGTGTCSQNLTNVFRVGKALQTNISASRLNSTEFKYQFSYSPVNSVFKNIKPTWTFSSGGTVENDNSPSKLFMQNSTSMVTLNLTDAWTGDSCVARYQVHATSGAVCDANFTTNFTDVKNSRIPSSVTLLLTDANGVVFSSKGLLQPLSSNFEVTEVSEYNANDKGEHTKSIRVKFNCIVKNGTTEINLRDGDAKVAVSFK